MTSCLTASKLMAPSSDRVERGRGDEHLQPQRLDELAFATITHAGFQESPQMLERFRKCPVLLGLSNISELHRKAPSARRRLHERHPFIG